MGQLIDRDLEHLKLLSIFHYVFGGLTALGACFALIYAVAGVIMLSADFTHQPGGGPPAAFGIFMIFFGMLAVIIGWTIAGLFIYAGRCLGRQTNYVFCLIVAGGECLLVPQGTVLGVFTLVVLQRPTVKELFDPRAPALPAPTSFG